MRRYLASGLIGLFGLFPGCMSCGPDAETQDGGPRPTVDSGTNIQVDAGDPTGGEDAGHWQDAGIQLSLNELATALCESQFRGKSNLSLTIAASFDRCSASELIPDALTNPALSADIGVDCLPGKEGFEQFMTALTSERVTFSYENFQRCQEKGREVRQAHLTYAAFDERTLALEELHANDAHCSGVFESQLEQGDVCVQAWDCPAGLYCQAEPLDNAELRCLPPAEQGEACAESNDPIAIRQCSTETHCYDGICVQRRIVDEPCGGASDLCITTLVCGPNDVCVAPGDVNAACASDTHCLDPLKCVNGNCVARLVDGQACTDTSLCAGICSVCRPSSGGSGQTVDGGMPDSDGGAFTESLLCQNRGGEDEACTQDDHCQRDYYCGPAEYCVPKGALDASCDSSRPCDDELTCSGNICVEPAVLGDVCAEGDNPCQDSFCVNGVCVGGNISDVCQTDAHCLGDHICVDEICIVPPRAGAPCASDGRCQSGLWCDEDRCKELPPAGDTCTPSNECDATAYCVESLCLGKKQAAGACIEDRECLSEVCLLGGTCGTEMPSCDTVEINFIAFLLFAALLPWPFRTVNRLNKRRRMRHHGERSVTK